MKNFLCKARQVSKWIKTSLLASVLLVGCTTEEYKISNQEKVSSSVLNLFSKSKELSIKSITTNTNSQTKKTTVNESIDNNFETRWTSKGGEVNLDIDLGAIYLVDYLDIAWYKGNKYIYEFEVYSSEDGVNYSKINSKKSTGTTEDLEPYELANGEYQYLRIKLFGPSNSGKGNTWNSIYEINVYGSEPVLVEPVNLYHAIITDTSSADMGELRLDLSETLPFGMMSVTISKEATQDGFINV